MIMIKLTLYFSDGEGKADRKRDRKTTYQNGQD